MKTLNLLGLAFLTSLALQPLKADILGDWTFETSQPATAGPFSPEIGSGSASGFHVGAAVYSSPVGNGSAHSFSSTVWAVGDYYQFEVSTLGYSDVTIAFDQASSNTGPGGYDLTYSTDGSSFTYFTSYTVLANASPNTPWTSATYNSAYTFNFSLTAVSALNNQSTVFLRLVDNSTVSASGGTVGTTGTDRVDNFVVSATLIPEPTATALAMLGGLTCWVVLRRLRKAVALAALLGFALAAPAQIYTIIDGNSSATMDTASPYFMDNWTLNGVNHLNTQTFMIGVNGLAENTLNTLGPATITPFNGMRGVTIAYGNPLVNVAVDYLLTGASATESDITESIRISNPTVNALTVHFFQYVDLNLGGTPLNDTAAISINPFTGLFGTADQWDGAISFSESVHSPGANFAEVAFAPTTFLKLTDGVPDNLNNFVGPLTGDVAWAFQWNFVIAAGDSVLISKDKYLTSTAIPEPSALGLVAVGLLGWIVRARRTW
jgi:hypothetical protein